MAVPGGKTISPFLAYANEQRPKLKETNPSLSFAEVQKQLGEMWGQLSDDQKQNYKNRPAQPKPTSAPSTPEPPITPTNKRILPKLAASPMTHYLATERENAQKEFPLLSRFELNDLLVKRWNSLTPDQKQHYEQHSAVEMARYTTEWNEFLVKNPDFEMDDDSDGGEYSPSDDEDSEEEREDEEDEMSDEFEPEDLDMDSDSS